MAPDATDDLDWTRLLTEQLDWHWQAQLRPRLDGLTDAEYAYEPVPDCWGVRPLGQGAGPVQVGRGPFRIDWGHPEPDPAPVTTIAWRLAHLTVGVFGERAARYFDGPTVDYDSYAYPPDATTALTDLDAAYQRWSTGAAALSPAEVRANCREPGFETESMASLLLHIQREAIHHGAEIALLRDLWAHGLRSVSEPSSGP